MAAKHKPFFCCYCNQSRTFRKGRINHVLHGLLSLVTVGLWSVVWITLSIQRGLRPWLCCKCGRERMPRSVLRTIEARQAEPRETREEEPPSASGSEKGSAGF